MPIAGFSWITTLSTEKPGPANRLKWMAPNSTLRPSALSSAARMHGANRFPLK